MIHVRLTGLSFCPGLVKLSWARMNDGKYISFTDDIYNRMLLIIDPLEVKSKDKLNYYLIKDMLFMVSNAVLRYLILQE